MASTIEQVAVIGAGVSGVVTAAHLKASGLRVTVFERSSVSGGVWVFDERVPPEPAYPSIVPSVAQTAYFQIPGTNGGTLEDVNNNGIAGVVDLEVLHAPPGPCYEGLSNNVPTGLMEVTLNSWKPGTAQNSKHNVLAEYIQDTSSKAGVDDVTLYNTKVEHLSKAHGKWNIQTSFLDVGNSMITTKDWEFDAVVVATGHYDAPNVPDIPGLKDLKLAWPSRIRHSKRYRSPRGYKEKTVLLIGGSTSSTDIAKELDGLAKAVYQSTRSGLFDHPVSMLPPSASRVSEISSFHLGSDPNRILDDSEPIPARVSLIDGQILTNIDNIIICTGYHMSFPFLEEYHRDSLRPEDADETALVTDGQQMHNLHKDIFYIPDPTLAFVGVPYHIATFSLFEFQAIAIAAVYSGKAILPSQAEQRAEYNLKINEKGFGRVFHSLRGRDVEYANELLDWINPAIVASGGTPYSGHSKEWKAQYEELRQKILNRKLGDGKEVQNEKVVYVAGIEASLEATEVH